jgi:hypothetical protein
MGRTLEYKNGAAYFGRKENIYNESTGQFDKHISAHELMKVELEDARRGSI